jgi:hypothetical protein
MADVERERVTALWREAAATVEQADALEHVRRQRDELQAECGRLREQLDATRETLERIQANAEAWHGVPPPDSGHVRALAVIAGWCRAALGVEGEPPMECGARKVLHVEGEEDARVYYCSQPAGHAGPHVERDLMWPESGVEGEQGGTR